MTGDDNGSGRRPLDGTGDDRGAGSAPESATGARRGLRGLPRAGADESLAPVIPLFGGRDRSVSAHPSVHGGQTDGGSLDAGGPVDARRPRLRPLRDVDAPMIHGASAGASNAPGGEDAASSEADATAALSELRDKAEGVLLRKLRSRSLSLLEARAALRATEGVDEVIVGEVIDRFVDLGYLDDATFAEQLAMTAVEKKGEGRRAVAETMRKRGIPRDIAEAALASIPDDDAERALEFARSKVRGVEGAEYDAALRRLGGQLARRGYPSSVALTAARTALEEAGIGRSRSFGRPASGVRFTPDE